jgi:choline dehydrogenase-like flavoprotein
MSVGGHFYGAGNPTDLVIWDFEANVKDGISVDWPVRYKEIAPWYDYVETFAASLGAMKDINNFPMENFCHR